MDGCQMSATPAEIRGISSARWRRAWRFPRGCRADERAWRKVPHPRPGRAQQAAPLHQRWKMAETSVRAGELAETSVRAGELAETSVRAGELAETSVRAGELAKTSVRPGEMPAGYKVGRSKG